MAPETFYVAMRLCRWDAVEVSEPYSGVPFRGPDGQVGFLGVYRSVAELKANEPEGTKWVVISLSELP